MKVRYKDKAVLYVLNGVSIVTAMVVLATFVMLHGFREPKTSMRLLHIVQIICFMVLIGEKLLRFLNAYSKKEFLQANWYEIPMFLILMVITLGAESWFHFEDPGNVRMNTLAAYLMFQIVAMGCRSVINVAASGRNPTQNLILIFLVLIVAGAGFLMLPRSYACQRMSFTDALFTATSATCVTGLVVKDTGKDFSLMGQIAILTLIQLGGLGIVIFGAVIALLLGQALNVRESVAMQDLLSTQTLGRIGNIIGFIFIVTMLVEAVGALLLLPMWKDDPSVKYPVFCSVFHSISAFCNAGFGLFGDSLMSYRNHWNIYGVVCPLIILGGLGFGVLYNLMNVWWDRLQRRLARWRKPQDVFNMETPVRVALQTKIVLTTSAILIVVGMLVLLFFAHYQPGVNAEDGDLIDSGRQSLRAAFFQSVTARTAGFNTVDIAAMSSAGKFILMVLMFIGGSPGSTAGGIKTVTLAVVVMIAWATLSKRTDVEMFKRSVRLVVVGRAITVTLLFAVTLMTIVFALSITEKSNDFLIDDIAFESCSALGTVGLTTGITPQLSTAGKWVIILAMLIGRLGPLTLLATLTFNLKPARYSYPDEPLVVG